MFFSCLLHTFYFFSCYFLPLVFIQTQLLRRCSRIRCTVLPNKQTRSNFTSSSRRQVTTIVLKTLGCGISAKPPTEAIETWGKPCKNPFLCWPSLLHRLFMVIRVQNKTTRKKMAFPICFHLAFTDVSSYTKCKPVPQGSVSLLSRACGCPTEPGRMQLGFITSPTTGAKWPCFL